jgi:hypothetical protein
MIDREAVQWLRGRGGVVTLRAAPRHGCCGGVARLPMAEPVAPDSGIRWPQRRQDGLIIHIDPALSDDRRRLALRVEGFFGLRRLFVEAITSDHGPGPGHSI